MDKTCRRCGETKDREEFYRLRGKQYKEDWDCRDSYCKTCRSLYHTERRRKVKLQCIELLGGQCQDCGLVDDPVVYDFHHIDPSKKDFSFGRKFKTFENIKPEILKCELLCSNCHRKRHT